MRKMALRVAVTTAAMGAALGLTVASASATTQGAWTVSPGGSFTAHAVNPTLDVPSAQLICDSADATGSIATSDADGINIGSIGNIAFNTCSVGGLDFDVTMTATPWNLSVTGVNSGNANWVDGRVSGISAHIEGPLCTADFAGTVYGHYENDTHALVIDGTGVDLVASNADCLGLISDDDVAQFNASFAVSPGMTITPA
ncbi:hypothetical protein [Streptomyces sp. NPDC050738]|uniref:hypothetical protein n=1 Tax=Streptomyces sp. NPDC050738 TaxID=3154744 RepID=UPI00342D07CB